MKIKSKKWAGIVIGIVALCFALAIGLGIYLHSTSQSTKPQRETHSSKITVNQFIKTIAPIAQKEQKKYHIPASIIIAQAGTESNWGRSKLAYKYNNLFGIKATSKKNRVRMYTKENINGKTVEVKQYFTVYNSWEASLKAHAELLAHGTKAKPNVFKDVLKAKNYQEAAWALQKDGYATDPNYASELIYAIKKFKLYKYDE